MMGEYRRNILAFPKNKITRSAYNQVRNADAQIDCDKNKIIKKFILKLRNKMKYNLLTFFNSKK